jgi:hypothetical protein
LSGEKLGAFARVADILDLACGADFGRLAKAPQSEESEYADPYKDHASCDQRRLESVQIGRDRGAVVLGGG